MSWRDRLLPTLSLLSPEGELFESSWIGNDRSFERKLGVFEYPGVDGSDIQDLGSRAVAYPLVIYFEGPDNDIISSRFFSASSQAGEWTITHPLKGKSKAVLVSIVEKIRPVENGNITQFDTQWIQKKPKADEVSLSQSKFNILDGVNTVNASTIDQFEDTVVQNSAEEKWAVVKAVESASDYIQDALDTFVKPLEELNQDITSVRNSMLDALTETTVSLASVGGQIQHLIQLPSLIGTDLSTRLTAYTDLLSSFLTDFSPDVTGLGVLKTPEEIKNTVVTQELLVNACFGAIAGVIVTSESKNRAESIEAIEQTLYYFFEAADTLDSVQDYLSDRNIFYQYFSQSKSFSDLYSTIVMALKYLLNVSYGQEVEKRFTLQQHRTPFDICVTEYGSLGDNDINLSDFISYNRLEGTEILILPPGKEVVVYV
jgi:hypothetical protein